MENTYKKTTEIAIFLYQTSYLLTQFFHKICELPHIYEEVKII